MPNHRESTYQDRIPPDSRPGSGVPVEVHTLGRFVVLVDGKPLKGGAKGPRKPFALLKVLIALGGQGVSTEQATDSLWPDLDGDRAQNAFRTALHRLRTLLGTDVVLLSDSRLTLNPASCWVDAFALQERLEAVQSAMQNGDVSAALHAAEGVLSLYGGPFLEGEFDPPEVLTARDRLHGSFLRQMGAAAEFLTRRGQGADALGLYQQGLERDELAEPFYLGLMRGLREQNRREEAIQTFGRMREVFASRMDAGVSPEAEALHRELEEEIAQVPHPGDSPAPRHDPPGIRTDAPAPPPHSLRAPRPWLLVAGGVAALIAVLFVGGALLGEWQTSRAMEEYRKSVQLPLPEEPSLAVMPFKNLSGDPDQEDLADAFGKTIATDLAYVNNLFVISYDTTGKFKGKTYDVFQVGRELGVRHILTGEIQREGDQLRMTLELTDVATGRQVWAKRYDRTMKDLFAVQDDLSRHVVTEMDVKLVQGDQARYVRNITKNPEALLLCSRASKFYLQFKRETNEQAQQLLEQALALDQDFRCAIEQLAWTHWSDARYGWSQSPEDSLRDAERLAHQYTEKSESKDELSAVLPWIYVLRRQVEQALEYQREVTRQRQNNSGNVARLGQLLLYAGKPDEAIIHLKRAMRLSPYYPAWYLGGLGQAYRFTGRYEEAEQAFRALLKRLPEDIRLGRVRLIALLAEMGRLDEARAEAETLMKIKPDFSVKKYGASRLYTDKSITKKLMANLRQAGLPD